MIHLTIARGFRRVSFDSTPPTSVRYESPGLPQSHLPHPLNPATTRPFPNHPGLPRILHSCAPFLVLACPSKAKVLELSEALAHHLPHQGCFRRPAQMSQAPKVEFPPCDRAIKPGDRGQGAGSRSTSAWPRRGSTARNLESISPLHSDEATPRHGPAP